MSADFDPQRFEKAWARYTQKAVEAHAPFMTYLNGGATKSQIDSAQQAISCELPLDLRHLLTLNNGSREHFVLPGWELFSTDRIVDEWNVWADLYRTQFKPENYRCEPNGPIRGDEWWRLKGIPFRGDGGGNRLCVDMDPADGGVRGQVITMWHDDGRRDLIAKSLTEFVEMIASDFEQGALTWDEEWGGVYASQDSDP